MRQPVVTVSSGGTVFPPVGKCIYCGSQRKLTKEHIVPFGLHGDLILPMSSCESCRIITSRFESFVLKDWLGLIRAKYGFRTQNNRKRHKPYSGTVSRIESDGSHTAFDLDKLSFPFMSWALPIWGPPGLTWPVTYEQLIANDRLECRIGKNDVETLLDLTGGKRPITWEGKFNPQKWAKLIAKIAHGYTCALMGTDNFEHILPSFILGDRDDYRIFVGGQEEIEPAQSDIFSLKYASMTSATGQSYIVAIIRLLSYLGTPTYNAVVCKDFNNSESFFKDAYYSKSVKVSVVGTDGTPLFTSGV